LRAILSPSDKRGLVSFARELATLGFELFASDGTARALGAEGVPVRNVSELTGHPEMLDGRVKTLHPAIYAGLLADRARADHLKQLDQFHYGPIDLVACNLYPFAATVESASATLAEAIENIDIGGVTLLRAAAKNYPSVVPVVDPSDYDAVIAHLREKTDDAGWRRALAAKTFRHIAAYDAHIAGYLAGPDEEFPDELTVAMTKVQDLRYGENPHQRAALYAQSPNPQRGATLVGARQLHGKELSFNNLLDVGAAFNVVRDYSDIAVSVIKHGNPCGLACGDDLPDAYRKAHLGDPVAAFGGAVGLNRLVDRATAELIAESHYDDLIAPGYADDALKILRKKRNLRIMKGDLEDLRAGTLGVNPTLSLDFRRIGGGFLVQTADAVAEAAVEMRTVSEREPTADELRDLFFAWRAVKHVKSNAIVLARGRALVGVGAGQMSRVDAVDIAVRKAGDRAAGTVLASDAYFPFPDGPELAARAGITAIVQPGGSVRDDESIRVANQSGLAMVFTGQRHFRH